AVPDGEPVAHEAAGVHRALVRLLLDGQGTGRRPRATGGDAHVVEHVPTIEQGRVDPAWPVAGGTELERVGDRHRLGHGAIEVLPGRVALAGVLAVDGDPHEVVVRAGIELHPEPDRVR